jgi:hypothetical protein
MIYERRERRSLSFLGYFLSLSLSLRNFNCLLVPVSEFLSLNNEGIVRSWGARLTGGVRGMLRNIIILYILVHFNLL